MAVTEERYYIKCNYLCYRTTRGEVNEHYEVKSRIKNGDSI
jgi:hypothetical protein